MRSATLGWLACVWLVACGADTSQSPGEVSIGQHDGGTKDTCVDVDGDGFGDGCDAGADCNDNDPAITNECRVCSPPTQGCKCAAGTKPVMCDPEDVKTVVNGVHGTLVCTEGFRYCRDGVFSDCEIIQMYARFIAD